MKNGSLYYREFSGEDPCVVILHGLFGSSSNWISVARALSPENRVITLDLRNHGQSFHHPEHTVEAMASDVAEFLSEKQIHNPVILGHSMGGIVAMHMAAHHLSVFHGLIVVDIAPRAYDESEHMDVFRAFDLDLSSTKNRGDVEDLLRPLIPDEAKRQFIMMNLERSGDHFQWKLNAGALKNTGYLQDFQLPDVFDLDSPVMFVLGENSSYIRPQDSNLIRKTFPQADIRTIPGAGHWLHYTHQDRFMEMVREFLNGIVHHHG